MLEVEKYKATSKHPYYEFIKFCKFQISKAKEKQTENFEEQIRLKEVINEYEEWLRRIQFSANWYTVMDLIYAGENTDAYSSDLIFTAKTLLELPDEETKTIYYTFAEEYLLEEEWHN